MGRLAQTEGLTEFERDILATVRDFTDKEILPVATELEHRDEYPAQIVAGMKKLGLFGLTIPEAYDGLGASLLLYALAVEEIARGWMSVSGIINTHFIVAHMIARHGTDEQKAYFLPRMAAGEIRGAFSMSEPGLGSDVAAIRTSAVRDGNDYVINGQKMWLTNGATASLVALLCRTGEGHEAPHRNLTTFLIEKEPGFGANATVPGLTVPGKIDKMGYKGVDTTELVLQDVRVPAARVLGGRPGRGFYQMMDGIEVGRVNVAARGCGVALRAFELAVDYAQRRHAFGQPIAGHQAIQFKLAEMATKVEAAHQMMVMAARRKDSGRRNDLEAGMAKYLAAEYCKEVVEDSFRIHGGYGFSREYEIERLYREAPMLLIGEGTAEIQKMIIGRRLLEEYKLSGLCRTGVAAEVGWAGPAGARPVGGAPQVVAGRSAPEHVDRAAGLPGGRRRPAPARRCRGWPPRTRSGCRKELAGLPAGAGARAPYGSGIYTAGWTGRTYAELLHRAAVLLAHGESVIADASFISARQRSAAAAAAADADADLVQLRCTATRELAAGRTSTGTGGVSDADEAVATQMAAAADPWPDATVIDTESGGTAGVTSEALEQALEAIRPHGPEHVWHPTRPYMLPG